MGQRTLAAFTAINVIERQADRRYAISPAALLVVVFGLRETMGLDLLSGLPTGE